MIKSSTIKQKIFLSYVALLVFPLLLIATFTYFKSVTIIEDKSVRQFNTVSTLASQQFDEYFRDIENLSINILQNSLLQKNLKQPYIPPSEWTTRQIENENEIRLFLNGIYRLKPGISSIMIYGFNDVDYYYHPTRRWDDSVDGSMEEWYRKSIEMNGVWTLSGKREERQLFNTLDPNPEEVVTFSRLIKDLDSFQPLGVMVINVKIEKLEGLATTNDSSSQFIIVDQEDTSIVGSDLDEIRVGEEDLLKVSTFSPYTKWTAVYITSKDALYRESKQIRNFVMGITVILLVVALLLAHSISAGIVKPLRNLREKMKDVAKGEFNSKLPYPNRDEVGELTHGFNRMVERVKELVVEIRNQEQQKMEIELNAMQARINPHFMYNTLNGIRWVAMMDGNQRVTDLITSFVYLLQSSAKNKDPLVSVKNELELIRHYVELMKMRNDQFDFYLNVEDEMMDHLIIPFILQPIVENAIFHGIIPSKERGIIHVDLRVIKDYNVAIVKDNGIGMNEETLKGLFVSKASSGDQENLNKIGIQNVYDRLKLQFQMHSDLQVMSELGEGTEVIIQWPIIQKEFRDD
jgi:two-component system sensor histidine kinase YesM